MAAWYSFSKLASSKMGLVCFNKLIDQRVIMIAPTIPITGSICAIWVRAYCAPQLRKVAVYFTNQQKPLGSDRELLLLLGDSNENVLFLLLRLMLFLRVGLTYLWLSARIAASGIRKNRTLTVWDEGRDGSVEFVLVDLTRLWFDKSLCRAKLRRDQGVILLKYRSSNGMKAGLGRPFSLREKDRMREIQ